MDKIVIKALKRIVGRDRVLDSDFSRVAYAADAGCYEKIPQVVLKPKDEAAVSGVLRYCYDSLIPVTFRAAGTSLSGQTISDSVLLQTAPDDWSDTKIGAKGEHITAQPGITGTRINQLLQSYGVQFGPDPASINSARLGGIIANNASGMSCGTHANSYATILSARLVFADGTILDTADVESRAAFEKSHASLLKEISDIRAEIWSKQEHVDFIRRKYEIKNTSGYGLNSFVDYEDPFDILLHLMVGSEGTLGFVSEATFSTIQLKLKKASSLIYFKDLREACRAVPILKDAGVTAIELMDRMALKSVEDQAGIPAFIKAFSPAVSALLIDVEAGSDEELDALIVQVGDALKSLELERDFEITKDAKQILEYWKVRKGVFPSVGGMRKPGTAVIIEDVAVRLEYLTDAVMDIRSMLDELGYADSVIYGHALDGNLHFIFSQDFTKDDELKRYEQLIEAVVKLIVDKYGGSLKAEHGTGINMAPFIAYEWGEELYRVMCRVKKVFDPKGILNPGVLINDDEKAHLKGFKELPVVDEIVDPCIECGFCEINCLTHGLTISARQRIVVQRALKKLDRIENVRLSANAIKKEFKTKGDASCAGDGLCAISCPLGIDTGVYIKKLREEKVGGVGAKTPVAAWVGRRFSRVKALMSFALGLVSFIHRVLGTKVLGGIAWFFRTISFHAIPKWSKYMPGRVKRSRKTEHSGENKKLQVVYFPSCINQTMGPASAERTRKPLIEVTVEVLERAGYEVLYPAGMKNLCCGTPWESKGFTDIANAKSTELEAALMEVSDGGEIPVLCDTSPCVYRMKRVMDKALKLYEPVEFIHEFLLGKMELKKLDKAAAFHVTCSSVKMHLEEKFRDVAAHCVAEPYFPEEVGCCGFAGDKGFTQPEINSWALRKLKLDKNRISVGYSNSRTCEIGLAENSGVGYESVMYLIDEASSS